MDMVLFQFFDCYEDRAVYEHWCTCFCVGAGFSFSLGCVPKSGMVRSYGNSV